MSNKQVQTSATIQMMKLFQDNVKKVNLIFFEIFKNSKIDQLPFFKLKGYRLHI